MGVRPRGGKAGGHRPRRNCLEGRQDSGALHIPRSRPEEGTRLEVRDNTLLERVTEARIPLKGVGMSDKIALVVRFRMEESAKEEFTAKMQNIFAHIVTEETFVEASLVQDLRDPQNILIYEVWNESPESFMKNQMSRAYRVAFEKMIVDLRIDRTPAWYSTIAEWTRA